MSWKAAKSRVPVDGMNEPRFRRDGGTRDMVLPGNKKFVEGDYLAASEARAVAEASGPAKATARTHFASF